MNQQPARATAELELRIHRSKRDGYIIDLRFVPAGSDADIEVLRDFSVPLPIDLKALNEHRSNDQAYGAALTEAIFGTGDSLIYRAYEKARDATRLANAILRLRLFVATNAADLHTVRWEALRDPHEERPLFLSSQLLFSRYLGSPDWRVPRLRNRSAMRALVAVANPIDTAEYGLAFIAVDNERERARTSLAPLATSVLDQQGQVTLNNLVARLREGYDLLYLVAHGKIVDEQAHIWLDGENGKGAWVPGRELAFQIRDLDQLPRLVLLVSCASAGSGEAIVSDEDTALAALGPLVATSGVPAVLAMQGNLTMETAQRLLPTFLEELHRDGQADRALAIARNAVQGRSDWWMPVLYTRLRHGRIWNEDQAQERPLDAAQIEQGLTHLATLVPIHAPGLEESFKRQASELRALLALPNPPREQLAPALAQLNTISEATCERSFAALAQAGPPALEVPACPFRGLFAFGVDDKRFFFGRDALASELTERVEKERLLAVVGGSGCGKSSLVLAGIVPRLQEVRPTLRLVTLKPGAEPLAQWDATVGVAKGRTLLVVIDQFEELFTLCADEAVRKEFIARIIALAKKQRVIVTMRADFTLEASAYPELRSMLADHQALIGPMEPHELQSAMEQQAVAGRLLFEPGLSQTILEDFVNEPGAMPLLQHALQELWKLRHGRWLRNDTYERIGRVSRALAQSADEFFLKLNADDQVLVRHLFVRLTRIDDSTSAKDQRDTRRRVRFSDLLPEKTTPERMSELLQRLATARLIVTSRNKATDEIEVEVAHETLIRTWAPLRAWLDANRSDLSFYETVRSAAQEWQANNHDADLLLHRGKRLQMADLLLNSGRLSPSALERRYLEACRTAVVQQGAGPESALLDLARARWAVVVNVFEDAAVLKALWPLIEHRMKQMGLAPLTVDFVEGEHCGAWLARHSNAPTEREYLANRWGQVPPVLIYRPGETKDQFLARHGTGHGPADTRKIPYYLLLVGKPGPVNETDEIFIPFEFQYQLQIQRAIGRLSFEQVEHYAIYARSVIAAETKGYRVPRQISMFAPLHRLDMATQRGHDELVLPMTAQLRSWKNGWTVQSFIDAEATKGRLQSLFGGSDTPALLGIFGHGLGLPLDNEAELRKFQGAIVCQEWSGFGRVKREHWFAGEDIAPDARLLGSIIFYPYEYSAGTPQFDDFTFDKDTERQQIAPHPLISQLPQRLLSHPNGAALAFIGHVDRNWTFFFSGIEGQKSVIEAQLQSVQMLMSGYPVGYAMQPFSKRYAEVAAMLALVIEQATFHKQPIDEMEQTQCWIALNSERNLIVLGDPAVRLAVAAEGEIVGQRPTLAELG